MEAIKKPKKQSKRIIAFVLVAALLIGGAFAFLTAQDSKSNVFTIGNIKAGLFEEVDLDYSQDIDDGEFYGPEDGSPPSFENVMPDSSMIKRPWIQNTGKNDEYVFMKVGIPAVKTAVLNDDGTSTGEYVETEFVQLINENGEIGVNDGWHLIPFKDTQDYQSKVDENGNIMHYYTYYYERELEARPDADQDGQDKTVPLFEKVKYLDVSNLATFDITTIDPEKCSGVNYTHMSLSSGHDTFNGGSMYGFAGYKIDGIESITSDDLENTVIYLSSVLDRLDAVKANTYLDGTASQKPGDMISGMSNLKAVLGDKADVLIVKNPNASFSNYLDGTTSEIKGYILNLRETDENLTSGYSNTPVAPGIYYLSTDVRTEPEIEFRQNTDTADHSTFYVPINAYAVQTEGVDFSNPGQVYNDFFTNSPAKAYKLVDKEAIDIDGDTYYRLKEISNVNQLYTTEDGETFNLLVSDPEHVTHCESIIKGYPGYEFETKLSNTFGGDNWDYYSDEGIIVIRKSIAFGVKNLGTYNTGDRIFYTEGEYMAKYADGTINFAGTIIHEGDYVDIFSMSYDDFNDLFNSYYDEVEDEYKITVTEDNSNIVYDDTNGVHVANDEGPLLKAGVYALNNNDYYAKGIKGGN